MFSKISLSVLSLAAAVSATKSLSVSVVVPASLVATDTLLLTTLITNDGDETLKLLNDPNSPLTSWATNTFAVTNEAGLYPQFTGVKVRYIPAVVAKSTEPSVFTVLEPGQTVDVTHEVGKYYNFTTSGAGLYTFEPVNLFTAVNTDGTLETIIANTTPIVAPIAESKLSSAQPLSTTSLGGGSTVSSSGKSKRASYRTNCSAARQSTNNLAITAGSTIASRSVAHLTANPSGSTVQTTWYGTFASSRYTGTLASFRTLVSAPASWTYDCSCTDSGTYAYVYPATYGVVYLCGYYWNAPATGSGSRADTIIHEGTHFPQVLGTDDVTYGEASCKALAKSSPAQAYNNADNHAFFSDYV